MTTEPTTQTLDQDVAPAAYPAPAPVPTATSNALSITSLVLSIVSIPTGFGVLAIVGVVLAFIARNQEPQHRSIANWGLAVGFASLFGWILFALIGVAAFAPFAIWGLVFGG